MTEDTKIEWCDSTFNPWIGCTKISPACDNCYAEELAHRYAMAKWGDHPRKKTGVVWKEPMRWQRGADKFEAEHGRPRFVFCASLADVFDNQVPEEWRTELWDLIKSTDRLVWLLLTKRPQNIAKMLPPDWGDGYPNVWLGTTVENQEVADRAIPQLLSVPATKRFLSCEPLLGPIQLTKIVHGINGMHETNALTGNHWYSGLGMDTYRRDEAIDWVIAGGESGSNARPSHPDWFRSLRDQCAGAGVPFHFKQWGVWRETDGPKTREKNRDIGGGTHWVFRDGTIKSADEFKGSPYADYVVRRFPGKTAGRYLDDMIHDGRPEA